MLGFIVILFSLICFRSTTRQLKAQKLALCWLANRILMMRNSWGWSWLGLNPPPNIEYILKPLRLPVKAKGLYFMTNRPNILPHILEFTKNMHFSDILLNKGLVVHRPSHQMYQNSHGPDCLQIMVMPVSRLHGCQIWTVNLVHISSSNISKLFVSYNNVMGLG